MRIRIEMGDSAAVVVVKDVVVDNNDVVVIRDSHRNLFKICELTGYELTLNNLQKLYHQLNSRI